MPTIRLSPAELNIIDSALSFLTENIDKIYTPADLHDRFLLNEKKLQAGFHLKTGFTIRRFQDEIRILQAKDFLHRSTMPIKQIASTVGYKDVSVFGRFFKRCTGFTPYGYRFKDILEKKPQTA